MRRGVGAALAGLLAAGTVTAVLVAPPGAGAVEGCSPSWSAGFTIPAPVGAPGAAALANVPNGPVTGYTTVGRDSQVYWVVGQPFPDGLGYGPLVCLGGKGVDSPALSDYTDGFDAFVLAPTGGIYERHIGVAIGPWAAVPRTAASSAPAAVTTADGSVHLFFRGTDGRLKRTSKSSTVGATWTAVQDLGGAFAGAPAVTVRPGLGFVVVVRTAAGGLYSLTRVGSGPWGTWTKLAGAASSAPAIAASAGQRDLFVIGSTGGLYRSGWNGTRFGPFAKVDGFAPAGTRLAAAGHPDGIVVYVRIVADGGASTGVTVGTVDAGWTPYVLAPYTYKEFSPFGSPTGGLRRAPLVPMPRPAGGR